MLELGTSGSDAGPGLATAQVYPTRVHFRYMADLDTPSMASELPLPVAPDGRSHIANHIQNDV
jgi:hypothetical protein